MNNLLLLVLFFEFSEFLNLKYQLLNINFFFNI
jgi:hypothetical protein